MLREPVKKSVENSGVRTESFSTLFFQKKINKLCLKCILSHFRPCFFQLVWNFPHFFLTGSLIQAVRRLVQTSVLQSDFLWLDDVYITGILASKAGVPLISVEVEHYLFISLCNNELYPSDRISMSRETPPPPCQPRPSIRRNIRSREVWITSCTGPGTATL